MKTLLICHHDAELHSDGLARWLASSSELVGVVILEERGDLRWKRIKREAKRVGRLRLLDVFAFRLYYKLFLSRRDAQWKQGALARLRERYDAVPASTPVLRTHSANTAEAEEFIRRCAPDVVLALCKQLIKASVFTIPPKGTLVMHPGVCPEYRNAHGCFWALANRDLERVGMTLLRIDKGVDTGPVFGYYTYAYDELAESHIVIQQRVVLENLTAIAARLSEIAAGTAVPISTAGRASAEWGQPWLTRYLRWKRAARREGKRERNAYRHA